MTRTELIQSLIDKYSLKSYLEIGVFDGANFNKIRCDEKISVDPKYESTHRMTSDKFFQINKYRYDLIYIDGLHEAYQVYRDICNAVVVLNEGGFIIVHDCNPATKWHTRDESEYNRGEEWNGTTYRGFLWWKALNKDASCFTVDTDYGCGVITFRDMVDNIIFNDDWEYFDSNRDRLLQLVSVNDFRNFVL